MTAVPRQDGFLVVEFQGDVIRTIPLTFRTISIGRAPDNDLSIQHPAVSRRHVELTSTPAGFSVTDLGSANGTFIDGVRILPHQPTLVEPGRTLQIGPFVLVQRRSPADGPDSVRPQSARANGDHRPQGVPAGSDDFVPVPMYPRRSTRPVPPPAGNLSKYLDYLPAVYAENDFLGRYLLIFEAIWEALEQRQDHIAMYFDPATCPEPFLPWLATWFDLKTGAHWPESRVRDLVNEVAEVYRYRGTRYGLAKMIEIWTDATPEITETPSEPFVFHVHLKLPAGSDIDRALVERLLHDHKPAATGFVLEIERA